MRPLPRHLQRFVAALDRTELGRRGLKVLRAANAVAHGFRGERISLRAAALTYITIFSLVPLVSVTLGLAHSLDSSRFEARLRAVTFTVLAPGLRDESIAFFNHFLRAAGSSAAGGLGFIVLLVSAGTLLRNLDGSLNDLWNVRRRRPIYKRVVLYGAILVLGPVLTGVTLLGSRLAEQTLERWFPALASYLLVLGPPVLVILALAFLYLYAPNAPVRLRSACIGALGAGLSWELARHLYAAFAAGAFRYNPVYGVLGAAPLFLAWIYVSWLLVLFGARLAYALDAVTLRGLAAVTRGHPRARELLAAHVIQVATLAQLRGEHPPLRRELASRWRVADAFLGETLDQLAAAQLIELGWQGGVRPAGDPDTHTLADISRAVGGVGAHLDEPALREWQEHDFAEIQRLFNDADSLAIGRLGHMTWRELALKSIEAVSTAPGAASSAAPAALAASGTAQNP